jgi:Ran GTPase-activating protein (RanGAP) involved in mRNA processing and transport
MAFRAALPHGSQPAKAYSVPTLAGKEPQLFFAGGRALGGALPAPRPAPAPAGEEETFGEDREASGKGQKKGKKKKKPTKAKVPAGKRAKPPPREVPPSAPARAQSFGELPVPVTELVFAKLPVKTRHVCRTVCREWARTVEGLGPDLWGRQLDFEGGRRLTSVDVWMNLSPCGFEPPRVSLASRSFRVVDLDLSSCELVSQSTVILLLQGCSPYLRVCKVPDSITMTAEGVSDAIRALDGFNSRTIRAALPGSHSGRLHLEAPLELDLFHDKDLMPLVREACRGGSSPFDEDECPLELRARSLRVLLEDENLETPESVSLTEVLGLFFGRGVAMRAPQHLEVAGHVGTLGLQKAGVACLGRTVCATGLSELNADHQGGGDALALAVAGALPASSLKLLSLRNNSVGDLGAQALFAAALEPRTRLESLDLGLNKVTGEFSLPGTRSKLTVTQDSPFPRLRDLSLSFNRVGDAGAAGLVRSLSSARGLRKIFLDGNRIGARGIRAVAELLSHSEVSSLFLDGNCAGAQGAQYLGRALGRVSSPLVELGLSGNALGNDGVHKLLLHGPGNLQLLGLQDNSLDGGSLPDLHRALASGSLRALNLSGNAFQDIRAVLDGVRLQQEQRPDGPTLEGLYLSDNGLDDASAISLAEFLKEDGRILRLLALDRNPIGDAGLKGLVQSLVKNPALLSISAMGCPCSLSVLRETTEFLKSRSLRTHSVSMPSSMIHPVQGSLDTEVVQAALLDL